MLHSNLGLTFTISAVRLCRASMSRRGSNALWRHLSVCALASWTLLLAGCQISHDAAPVRRAQPLLGTFVVITAYGPKPDAASRAISAAFEEIRRIDSLMSLHRTDSELLRLNSSAAREAVAVSEDLFFVISNAVEIARQT